MSSFFVYIRTDIRGNVQILPDCLREIHLLKINKKWYPLGDKLFRSSQIFKGPLEKINFAPICQMNPTKQFWNCIKMTVITRNSNLSNTWENNVTVLYKFLTNNKSHTILYQIKKCQIHFFFHKKDKALIYFLELLYGLFQSSISLEEKKSVHILADF